MAMAEHVMGIDVGTGSVRAVIARMSTGAVVGTGTGDLGSQVPQPGWSEQRPEHWWAAATTAIPSALAQADLNGSAIAAIGLTGQMHGCTLVDEAGDPTRPAVLWNDQRTSEQCHALTDLIDRDRWLEIAGKPPLCGLTLPSLLWVREHDPDAFDRARTVLLPKDFLRLCLTGERATDVADASGTMLLDLRQRQWSSELTAAVDLDPDLLPPVHEAPTTTGVVHARAADATGLAHGTPVVAGGGDQQTGALSCGISSPGTISLNLGTSGVVFAAVDALTGPPPAGLHAFCHCVPDTWHVMGVMLSAGGSLRWWRDTCHGQYDAMVDEAMDRPAGSAGVLFLPYLSGERTPHENPFATGAFLNLRLGHDRGHLTRAVMEGVCMGLRDALELIRQVEPVQAIRITGGATASPAWRQVLADVLGLPVTTLSTSDGSAMGAAILAAVAAGRYPDVPGACSAMVHETGTTDPGPDAPIYDDLHRAWRAAYSD